MEQSDHRPSPNAKAPDLTKPKEVLEALLEIEWARLLVAQKIEEERKIVFPETTVIIRDIQKLMAALGKDGKPPTVPGADIEVPQLGEEG